MSRESQTIPPAQALSLPTLITPTRGGVASGVLAKTSGGNVTLFAFDAGQGLEEHTSPFDALEAPEATRMLLVMLRDVQGA